MTLLEKFTHLGFTADPKLGFMGVYISDMTKEELMVAYTKLHQELQAARGEIDLLESKRFDL